MRRTTGPTLEGRLGAALASIAGRLRKSSSDLFASSTSLAAGAAVWEASRRQSAGQLEPARPLGSSHTSFHFTVEDADSSPLAVMDTLPFSQARKKYSLAGVGPSGSQEAVLLSAKLLPCSQVESWALEFDQLLVDPAGLQTFSEFLKKEFSHENIYFWCACERFRRSGVPGPEEIIERHLGPAAWEPVNVDAAARTSAQDAEVSSDRDMFLAPQKQIYNLMKFDSYGRFLKSELYQACLLAETKGRKLPFTGQDLDRELTIQEQARKAVEPRSRRRSFLPWSAGRREPGRPLSRSSETLDSESSGPGRPEPSGLPHPRLTPSVSDLNLRKRSEETGGSTAGPQPSCRVSLPDGSAHVVTLQGGESVAACLGRLLARRGLPGAEGGFQALEQQSRLPLELGRDSARLAGREVRVVPGEGGTSD